MQTTAARNCQRSRDMDVNITRENFVNEVSSQKKGTVSEKGKNTYKKGTPLNCQRTWPWLLPRPLPLLFSCPFPLLFSFLLLTVAFWLCPVIYFASDTAPMQRFITTYHNVYYIIMCYSHFLSFLVFCIHRILLLPSFFFFHILTVQSLLF